MAGPDDGSPSEQALRAVPASPDPPVWQGATELLDEMAQGASVLRAVMQAGPLAATRMPGDQQPSRSGARVTTGTRSGGGRIVTGLSPTASG